ncbi:hypothetical protein BN135_3361 [Cronobacter muytjensii 530]
MSFNRCLCRCDSRNIHDFLNELIHSAALTGQMKGSRVPVQHFSVFHNFM